MTRCAARAAALMLFAGLALPARADITLSGSQHIGDGETAGSSFDPDDPVSRAQMRANPSHFHLSQAVVVTAVRLENADDLDGRLQVFIDDMTTPLAGTLSGSTYTLTSPVTLAAGTHTIWPDGGCSFPGGFGNCNSGENDFGFSAITLVSSQISFSRAFTRRTHLGTNSEGDNDYLGDWYPDAADGASVSRAFTVEASRSLTEIRFYRLRGISNASAGPRVYVDGSLVGNVSGDGNPAVLSPGLALGAGAHTLTVEVGQLGNGNDDDISWDDIVLVMINNPSTTPGDFNAVEVGADAATGAITTKTAGSAFNLDLVAVNSGVQFTAYTGTVSVELVDASSAAGSCANWTAVANLGSVTFAAADQGRKTVTITYADALKDARVRLTDAALALSSCSTDNFALRPHTFGNVTATHGDSSTAGTTQALASGPFSGSTLPVHRAGRPFTLRATAYNSAGVVTQNYAGEPTVSATATLLGAVAGSAEAASWTYPGAGTVRSDTVTYGEAGAVRLQLVDTSFAAVDADDTDAASRATVPVTVDAGRFIPDHFTFTPVVDAEFMPGCPVGGFTYVGQSFPFTATPSARITAVAADGSTPTRNYTDAALYRIALSCPTCGSLPASTYAAASGTFDASIVPDPDNTFVNEGNGASLFTLIPPASGYRFTRGAPQAPFDADIGITLSLVDSDGVAFAAADPGRFGNAVAGEGIPFAGDGNLVRFGRLAIDNAHGSERLDLLVPLRAEFWNGGFQTNSLDTCTGLTLGHLAVTTGLATTPSVVASAGGNWSLKLTAPNVPGQVTVDGALGASFPWLLTDREDADTDFDDEAQGIATFGLSNDRQRRIFQREVVGY